MSRARFEHGIFCALSMGRYALSTGEHALSTGGHALRTVREFEHRGGICGTHLAPSEVNSVVRGGSRLGSL